ncbi:hypothetical protein NDA14_007815 [Ustilago hordei]|nr:hypothetical protein NDA10_005651 [Ustilago hordei]KAJ1591922.1 hypothetical protein NDA12_004047 [Ustilago hordei]KAJ1603555.1 hypothetical protein NDA14_007815 [Ustilago hordei]
MVIPQHPRRPIMVIPQHCRQPIMAPSLARGPIMVSSPAQGPIMAPQPLPAHSPATRATGSSGSPITAPGPITAPRLITATPPGSSTSPPVFDLSAANACTCLLLQACCRIPAPQPNTMITSPVFDATDTPAHWGSMQEQAPAWQRLLAQYLDKEVQQQLLGGISHGVCIGYDGPLHSVGQRSHNLPMDAAGLAHICHKIHTQLAEGCLTVVYDPTLLVCSPVGTVPKLHSDKLRTIHHLSHPCCPGPQLPSVNAGIQPAFMALQYESLQPLVEFIQTSSGCWLWKSDLQDAFRHIVTCLYDARLLGLSFDGVSYHKNVLTFGGKSSPWLFNLYAEMVHWVVSSCLPSSLSWAWMLKKQEGHWFIWKEHRYRRSSRYQYRAWS